MSIYYSPTEDEEGINIKRGIAGAFQANFERQEEVEELDPGSTHISHYRYVHSNMIFLYTYVCILNLSHVVF